MTGRRTWSTPRLAAGAVVVAGVTAAVVPQHALGITRVLVAAVALVALGAAVADRLAPYDTEGLATGAAHSPFETATRPRSLTRDVPSSVSRIRGELATGPVRADLAPLSPLAARRLAAIAEATLAREGLSHGDPDEGAAAQASLSPQAWAAITAHRTGRPRAGERAAPRRTARADEIAATVHALLDEIERPAYRRGR